MTQDILVVESLSAGYGKAGILKDVDFRLAPGAHLAILGPNGSGKTTLLRCISGIIPDLKGKIYLHGQNAVELDAAHKATEVAVVTQNPPRPPGIDVRSFILLGRFPWLDWTGVYRQTDLEAAELAIRATGLQNLAGRNVDTLSGGEWQRAILARALAQLEGAKHPLLLLDELAAGLDLRHCIGLFDFIENERRAGLTIVSVMHSYNMAAIYATHILGIKNGKNIFYGEAEKVFSQENLGAIYDLDFGIFIHPDLRIAQAYPRWPLPHKAAF